MKRVLITAIGSSAAAVLISELKKSGYYVVGCDINEKKYLYEAMLVDEFEQIPYYNNRLYLDVLERLVEYYAIDALLPLTDPEVEIINKNRERFSNVSLWVVPDHIVCMARDKKELAKFMNEKFAANSIKTVSDIDKVHELEFPIIAKPKNGRSSQGIEKIYCLDEFLQKKHLFDDNYLFQTFIDGSIYTVDVIRDRKGNTVCIPRIEVIRNVSGLGLSVRIAPEQKLITLCKEIATEIELYGCINIEFIKKNNTFYLIEINPRCSGGIAFSQKSGYDFVGNLSNCYNGFEIKDDHVITEKVIVKNYVEFITDEN